MTPDVPSRSAAALHTLRDPEEHALRAGLRYSSPDEPGYGRVRTNPRATKAPPAFEFRDAKGRPVTAKATLERIAALAIPPAWEEVWICTSPRGHLQAVGTDEAGRRQYRYHEDWSAWQQQVKFSRQIAFAERLPALRRRVRALLRRDGLGRDDVLALLVRLLDDTNVRIGSERYRRRNRSFGLTTLRNRHLKTTAASDGDGRTPLRLEFRGKSGNEVSVQIDDPAVEEHLRDLQDLPGQHLFQYLDADGARHRVGSADVNDFIREAMGEAFTAKDFRTWGATVATTAALGERIEIIEAETSERRLKRAYNEALDVAAERLHNTRAVIASHYVNPRLWTAVVEHRVGNAFAEARADRRPCGLRLAERATWRLVGRVEAE